MNFLTDRKGLFLGLFLTFIFVPNICFGSDVRSSRSKLVTQAKKYVGCSYELGSTGPNTFDCSGLILTVAREAIGYQMPRTAKSMYEMAKHIPDNKKEPGDLVFFKSSPSGPVSHVGLYIGRNQFISAVSDGPNTGVIVSSLKENYWKTHYFSSGRFLKSTNEYEEDYDSVVASADDSSEGEETVSSSASFADRVIMNFSATGDWSLFTQKRFMPNFRGVTANAGLTYQGKAFSPGVSVLLRWNNGVKAFQLPVVGSLEFGKYIKVYAGPVFTIGECHLPDSDEKISSSIFPGVMGIVFQTPSITKGSVKIKFIQDICYTIFNNADNSALSPAKAFSAGLEFATGISVSLPMSTFSSKASND